MAHADVQVKPAKVVTKDDGEVEEKKPITNGGTRKVFVKKEERDTSASIVGGKEVKKEKKRNKKEAVAAVKKKKKEVTLKSSKDTKDGQKQEVYVLPGQKYHPPNARDPLRIFYETLHEQLPTSDMAAVWLMKRGLLPEDEAKKVYEKKSRESNEKKIRTPLKTVAVESVNAIENKTSASNIETKNSSKKLKSNTSDNDD